MILALGLWLLETIPPELPFRPWFTQREVAVSIARVPEGPPWVRGVAELPVPAEAVFAVITDYEGYLSLLSPAVKEVSVLERRPATARLHFVWPYPFPFRNRDAVVAYRHEKLDGGAFLLAWRDDARPGDPREGVRIQRVAGETRIEPLGAGRCRVTYTYLADLGGNFPKALEEKAWRLEPVGYILALRRRLNLDVVPLRGADSER